MLWLQGAYIRMALASTPVIMGMSKGSLPKYPKMPYAEDTEEKLSQNEEWLQKERQKAFDGFVRLLTNCKKGKK